MLQVGLSLLAVSSAMILYIHHVGKPKNDTITTIMAIYMLIGIYFGPWFVVAWALQQVLS